MRQIGAVNLLMRVVIEMGGLEKRGHFVDRVVGEQHAAQHAALRVEVLRRQSR